MNSGSEPYFDLLAKLTPEEGDSVLVQAIRDRWKDIVYASMGSCVGATHCCCTGDEFLCGD